MHHDAQNKPMSLAALKAAAADVASQLSAATGAEATPGATGGGSAHRGLPDQLRSRFIDIRSALIERGIFDPVLIRFDTATVPQASTATIAQQLATVAESL